MWFPGHRLCHLSVPLTLAPNQQFCTLGPYSNMRDEAIAYLELGNVGADPPQVGFKAVCQPPNPSYVARLTLRAVEAFSLYIGTASRPKFSAYCFWTLLLEALVFCFRPLATSHRTSSTTSKTRKGIALSTCSEEGQVPSLITFVAVIGTFQAPTLDWVRCSWC